MSSVHATPARKPDVLLRPGASWSRQERVEVCEWLLEGQRYRSLLSWASRFLGDYAVPEDVEDAVGGFLEEKLPGIIASFDPQQASFMTYALSCLRQYSWAYRARLERYSSPRMSLVKPEDPDDEGIELVDARPDAEKSLEERDLVERINRAVQVMPSQFSSVLILSYQGKSIAEMAARFGISTTNAKQRLFRARRMLRQLIDREAAGK